MLVLIQDSQGTSSTTVENIKTVVRAMLRQLSSESTDFKFALAKYATSRRMSCFGSAQETINYVNNKYQHGGIGRNRLELALNKMVLEQFDKRRGDRKTDTAKVWFTFFCLGPNYVIKNYLVFNKNVSVVFFLFLYQNYITQIKIVGLKFACLLQSNLSLTTNWRKRKWPFRTLGEIGM